MHLEEIKDLLIQAGYGPTRKPQNLDRLFEIEDTLHELAGILQVKPLEVGNEVVQLLVEQNDLLKRVVACEKIL